MSNTSGLRTLGTVFLVMIASLLICMGWGLSFIMVPQPAVGIIRLNGDIWAGSTEVVKAQIREARRDDRIKAVVVQLSSGGGEVVASQVLYLELQNLRREMPVVGSIDGVAASGGYYTILAADPIYAKPSSTVGNVGVWSFAPPDLGVNEVVLASGPFKLTASNRDEFVREIDGIKQDFMATVFSQRGERIQLSEVELTQGLAYSGRESVRLGLIDKIATRSEAIELAAQQAGISHYDVVDLEIVVFKAYLENGYLSETWSGAADPISGERNLAPGLYLLYDPHLRGTP